MAKYDTSSPYYSTAVNNGVLDLMKNRYVPKYSDDVQFTINQVYDKRPDLLAHDLYEDARLWWVFASRNPNTLKDPLFDFVEGVTIYLPKAATLKQSLGL